MTERSVAQKMGIKPGWRAHSVGAPDGFQRMLGLPRLAIQLPDQSIRASWRLGELRIPRGSQPRAKPLEGAVIRAERKAFPENQDSVEGRPTHMPGRPNADLTRSRHSMN